MKIIKASRTFDKWYDLLSKEDQAWVDDLADSEGLPYYDDCSESDLNFLMSAYQNHFDKFGSEEDPDYLRIKKISDFLDKEYPDSVEPGIDGYFLKWGDETAVQEYGYDEAQRICDDIFEETGINVNISGNGEFVVAYY